MQNVIAERNNGAKPVSLEDCWEALGERFPEGEEKSRQGSYNKTLGGYAKLTYIDARAVMDRLDLVCGPDNWSEAYTDRTTDKGGIAVECQLTVFGVTRADVGQASDEDEPMKSAYSDALKRAAVHFNIGRYLYSLPKEKWNGPTYNKPAQPQQTSGLADYAQNELDLKRVYPEAPAAPEQTATDNPNPPSDKQMNYLRAIAKGQGMAEDGLDIACLRELGIHLNQLTGGRDGTMSQMIEIMKAKGGNG